MPDPTVLLLSMRRLSRLVAYCSLYEFEDILQSVSDVDRIEPSRGGRIELFRRVYKYSRLLTGSHSFALRCAPRSENPKLLRHYDLFLAVFNHPHELAALSAIPDWRRRARSAVCFIAELWLPTLPRYLLELLSEFDRVFVSSHHARQEVSRASGRPCTYLPMGADVLTLAPPTDAPARIINVANLGRRSPVTHDALLSHTRERSDFFYFYDSVAASGAGLKQRTFVVQDPVEHRRLLASILHRTRFYIANRARVNEPALTVGGDEISSRFYEGAASGTVMIGESPLSEEFDRQFDWPDAVVRTSFDSPNIADLLLDLERDPARLLRIQRENISQAALRHDWLYRIETIFQTSGLTSTQRMQARKQELRALDARVRGRHDTEALMHKKEVVLPAPMRAMVG